MIVKIALIALQLKIAFGSDESPTVQLPTGWIQGSIINQAQYSQQYIAFQGVPYAAPPTGDLRFEKAQPVESWSNVLNTRDEPPSCEQQEDCLYLNVYTPTLNNTANLSVMIFFYGGGFTSGSSAKSIYGPEFLVLEGGVVLVTANYRIGPFGFLSTGDTVLPGNLGLKDQVFVLQWVQENIHLFGGDKAKVTIFGESAGAASVGLHLISEKSKGLFRAAICESGSALNPWTADTNPKAYAYELARLIDTKFSSTINSTLELKQLLLKASYERILAAQVVLLAQNKQAWPVIEPENYTDAFIDKPHYDLIGKVSQVPLLIGDTSEESLYVLSSFEAVQVAAVLYDHDVTQLIPGNFPLKSNASKNDLGEQIKNIYLPENGKFADNLDKVVKFTSDQNFVRSNMEHALLHSKYAPVYFYEFSYEGRPLFNFEKIPGCGSVPHAGELPFLFNITIFSQDQNKENILTQQRMTRLWTNFAKYLNPTPEPDKLLQNITWPKIDTSDFTILNINNSLTLDKSFKKETFISWRTFFLENGVPPFITF